MLDLSTHDLAFIQETFQKYIPDQTVLAYGSRVKGNSHEGSDLDLVIINPKKPEQPQPKLAELQTFFSESNLTLLIDLHDWANLPDDFRKNIFSNYVLIFGEAVRL